MRIVIALSCRGDDRVGEKPILRSFPITGEGRMSVSQALWRMAQGKIAARDLITHTFPLARIREAIDTFAGRRDGASKVVAHP